MDPPPQKYTSQKTMTISKDPFLPVHLSSQTNPVVFNKQFSRRKILFWYVAFANFLGVNIPTTPDFKLSL